MTIGPRGDGIWDVGEVMTFLSGEPCHVPRLLLVAVPARDGALAKMHYSSTAFREEITDVGQMMVSADLRSKQMGRMNQQEAR